MSDQQPEAKLHFDAKRKTYFCEARWTILYLANLLEQFEEKVTAHTTALYLDGSKLSALDTAGAFALLQCIDLLEKNGKPLTLIHFKKEQLALIKLASEKRKTLQAEQRPAATKSVLYRLGKETMDKLSQARGFLALVGDLSVKLVQAIGNWHRFHLPSIITNLHSTGIQALPILALLSFLIGVVLAYQMGIQLETYGATNFIAYICGMAIFREFGPLIAAIIVAGRTSSAFTAQIGNMKVNEEIDAIKTMGLSPVELLVLPKVIGLSLMFPLLIFWSDVFNILGAMFMAKWSLNINHFDFLTKLKDSVGVSQLRLGLYKAPAFAILIAMVGCFQGFRVQASADNIGSQTTKSVVQALFLIIITDAIYSVIYSWLDL